MIGSALPYKDKMGEPSAKSIPLPKVLWDELESALMIKSKDLIRDIAKTLRQDEANLLKEFRSKKRQLFLLELERENEEGFQCSALICSSKIAHRCRRPVAYGTKFCPAHEFFTMPNDTLHKPSVQRIEGEELFVDTLTQQVYTIDQERVGYMQKEKCIVFKVEEG